jgi:hypothetical protein
MKAPDRQTDIDAFIEYAARLDPSWPMRIRGASEEKRARFRERAGVRFPDLYEGFLMRLGEDPGGLKFCVDAGTQIDDVCDYYREAQEQSPSWIPSDAIVIGVEGVGVTEMSLYPVSSPEPRVMHSDGDKIGEMFAASLATLLYRTAFHELKVDRSRVRITYSNAGPHQPLNGALAAITAELGFDQQWFSDDVCYCGTRQNASIFSFQPARQPLGIVVAATDEATAASIGGTIGRRLGLERLETIRNPGP